MSDRENSPEKRLHDFDLHDPAIHGRYGQALGAQLEASLSDASSARRRAGSVLMGLGGLSGFLVCGSLALTEPASTPFRVRAILSLFACFGLAWIVLATWGFSRSRGNFSGQNAIAARMGFGFTLVSIVALAIFASASARAAEGMPMLTTALAMLILATVMLIDSRIGRAESALREQILRLEVRLVDLSDRLAQGPKQSQ
ncbi:hypothetical protein EP7_002159 [Isosphaeraceae bacterium EP7]